MPHKSQFKMCNNCEIAIKCCKIVPPMIFQFEQKDFQDNIFYNEFNSEKIPLLNKSDKNCIFLKDNKCSIYQKRPLNCKMFPIDIKRINDKLYWINLDFCKIPENIESNLNKFENALLKIPRKELDLYVDYSNQTKELRKIEYQIIREVSMPPVKIEILHHNNHKFMFLDGYLWMWDTPQETELQEDLAKKSFGDVLVAGYGLGILPKFLLTNQKVKSVTTIEVHKEVIKKMREFGKIYGKIIIGNYYDLPENKKYDCIIGDIWPDIDAKFLNDYISFKRKSRKLLKKNGKVLAWGKDFFEYLLKDKSARS